MLYFPFVWFVWSGGAPTLGACTSRRWESHGVGRDVSECQGEQENIAFASKRIDVYRLASSQWLVEAMHQFRIS